MGRVSRLVTAVSRRLIDNGDYSRLVSSFVRLASDSRSGELPDSGSTSGSGSDLEHVDYGLSCTLSIYEPFVAHFCKERLDDFHVGIKRLKNISVSGKRLVYRRN